MVCSRSAGPSFSSPSRWRMRWTVVAEAISPPAWPPMPSAMTNSRFPMKAESWLVERTTPTWLSPLARSANATITASIRGLNDRFGPQYRDANAPAVRFFHLKHRCHWWIQDLQSTTPGPSEKFGHDASRCSHRRGAGQLRQRVRPKQWWFPREVPCLSTVPRSQQVGANWKSQPRAPHPRHSRRKLRDAEPNHGGEQRQLTAQIPTIKPENQGATG